MTGNVPLRLSAGVYGVTANTTVLVFPHAGRRYHRHFWCVPSFHMHEWVTVRAAGRLGLLPCLRCFPRGVSFWRSKPV